MVSQTPEIDNDYIFFSTKDGYLYNFSQSNHKLIWKKKLANETVCIKAIDSSLFYGDSDGKFYCVNKNSGQEIWSQKALAGYISKPLIVDNNIVASNDDGFLYCWSQKRGELVFKTKLGKTSISAPILMDSTIFIGTRDGKILGFDKHNGNIIWIYDFKELMTSTPLIDLDKLYIGCHKSFYCINIKTKTIEWKFNSDYWIISTPVIKDNLVFFGGTDGFLYALDKLNGTQRWKYFTAGPIDLFGPIVKDNVVITGSKSGWKVNYRGIERDMKKFYSK